MIMKLRCFTVIPSNRETGPVTLVPDDRWGLAEMPSSVEAKPEGSIELDFDVVYEEIIQTAVASVDVERDGEKVAITCLRGTDLDEAGDILSQVIEETCRSEITIIDLTTLNPNVFLELGIRLVAKDRLNILICHNDILLPFDVHQHRVIRYGMDAKTANSASKQIDAMITKFLNSDPGASPATAEDRFKRYFDIYTGRKRDRDLVDAYSEAPKLVSDLASYLFARKQNPTLKPRLFEFIGRIKVALSNDPEGSAQAIAFLETVSQIDKLSAEKLGELYMSLWKICDADHTLKHQAAHWMKKMEDLEAGET